MRDSKIIVATHQRGSTLRFNITISNFDDELFGISEIMNVDDLALYFSNKKKDDTEETEVSVIIKNDKNTRKYTVRITCENFSKLICLSEEWGYIVIVTKKYDAQASRDGRIMYLCTTEVNITVHEETSMPMFVNKRLYEDSKSTDFQLHAADGTVAVHQAVLFIHGDMFRTMLGGEWKETEEGRVKVDGVTVQTLQHLKDYMYLGTLPDEGLEPLLLFAARYLMDKLKEDCIAKLLITIKPDNFDDIVELASQHNTVEGVTRLIMETPDNAINKVHHLKINTNTDDDKSLMIVTTHQRGATLRLNIYFSHLDYSSTDFTTDPINIDDLAQVVAKCKNISCQEIQVTLRMIKNENTRKLTVRLSCDFFSKPISLSEEWVEFVLPTINYNGKIKLRYESLYTLSYTTEVNITVDEETSKMPMFVNKRLYEDTKLTDFQLHTADGTVAVHKAVLYIHSDMFRTMLGGEWTETGESRVKVDGVTVQTLQHLKDYMYLGTLPDEGLESLLLFAARYLMDELKEDCIAKLIKTITPENFDGIVELASQNNMGGLVRALVMDTSDDVINKVRQFKKNMNKNDKK